MQTRKLLLLCAGMIAIVALIATTVVFADPPTQCTTQDFVVNVETQTVNGLTTYRYTIANNGDSSENPNKFSVYVKGRQTDGQGLEGDLEGFVNGDPAGDYVYNSGSPAAKNCPPPGGWAFNKTDDAFCFQSVAIDKVIDLKVSERFKPEEGTTDVVLGWKNVYQVCGPILGPTTPSIAYFQGETRTNSTAHLTFENGCSYYATVELTTGRILNMWPDPDTPFETNYPGESPQACYVDGNASCADDLNVPSCGVGNVLYPPVQSENGGTCYYPPNWKFPC